MGSPAHTSLTTNPSALMTESSPSPRPGARASAARLARAVGGRVVLGSNPGSTDWNPVVAAPHTDSATSSRPSITADSSGRGRNHQ